MDSTNLTTFFANAALLIAAVYAMTQLVKHVFPTLPAAVTQGVVFVLGIAVVFLCAYSTYAHGIEVGGKTLDDVNAPGLILIGLLLAGGATAFNETLGAIRNVGDNQPADAPAEPVSPDDDFQTVVPPDLPPVA